MDASQISASFFSKVHAGTCITRSLKEQLKRLEQEIVAATPDPELVTQIIRSVTGPVAYDCHFLDKQMETRLAVVIISLADKRLMRVGNQYRAGYEVWSAAWDFVRKMAGYQRTELTAEYLVSPVITSLLNLASHPQEWWWKDKFIGDKALAEFLVNISYLTKELPTWRAVCLAQHQAALPQALAEGLTHAKRYRQLVLGKQFEAVPLLAELVRSDGEPYYVAQCPDKDAPTIALDSPAETPTSAACPLAGIEALLDSHPQPSSSLAYKALSALRALWPAWRDTQPGAQTLTA